MLGRKRHRPIPCLSCGYDITGLARGGVCPECAFPLKDTLESSRLLRGWPRPVVRRIRRAVLLLAWSTSAAFCGIPAGFIIATVWVLLPWDWGRSAWVGLVAGPVLGLLASVVCFVAGALLITRPGRALTLGPAWARLTLRWVGPAAGALALTSPVLLWCRIPMEAMVAVPVRAVVQVGVLATLAALIRVCASVERRTQTSWAGPRVFSWIVLGVLALIWGYWYWILPLTVFGSGGELAGEWGVGWALAALALQFAMLWRVVDSVSLEATIAGYDGRRGGAGGAEHVS